MHRDYDYQLKICLIGESQVGKTSILTRYIQNHFEQTTLTTIGVDFKFKSFNHQGSFIKLSIWDTAGQERFRSIVDKYYKDADAIIIVYDSIEPKSFYQIDNHWLPQVRRKAKPEALVYVFANKCEQRRGMGRDERDWCKRERIMGFEVSAKTGEGITEAMEDIVHRLVQIKPKLQKQKIAMKLEEISFQRPKNKCC